jgi:hypothetical protein
MWNEPTQEDLAKVPGLYETEHIPVEEKLVHMHFFMGSANFYAMEWDGEDQFFGYVSLGDHHNAEFGYFSLSELKSINHKGFEIDRDLYWEPKPAKEVPLIKRKLDDWKPITIDWQ